MRPGLGHLEPSPERDRPCGLFLAVTARIRAGTSDTASAGGGEALLASLPLHGCSCSLGQSPAMNAC